jgi:putative oxidoreductase
LERSDYIGGMTVGVGDVALLGLRLMVAGEFFPSAYLSARDPAGRGKGEGLSPGFMLFIAIAEVAGSLGLVFGVLARWAAMGLMIIGVGAMQKKVFVWRSGYWGKDGYGAHYDLMLFSMNFVIAAMGSGRLSLWP